MDMNFIFSCSPRYLTSECSEISSWPLEDKIHVHERASIYVIFCCLFDSNLKATFTKWMIDFSLLTCDLQAGEFSLARSHLQIN